ncbi:MAG: HAD-IA family hydrolase [Anaerovoracaceae bacterium]|jgi:pyrophosphatase PpaX|nr:HAD-IA family hydrolase [Anaerovoracaceae bacterium]
MTKKTTLLFDFDGTIMDTTNVIVQSWQQVYRHVTGKEGDPDTILGTFGTVLRDGLADAFPGEPVEELLKIYREFQYDRFLDLIELYPGIREMLNILKESDVSMALVTSRLKRTTMQAVQSFDLGKYFDVIITADDCTKHKPDPEPILTALDKLNGRDLTDAVLMIGDTVYDRECARNAGVASALVAWAPSLDVHELKGSDAPEYVLEKPADIFRII